MRKSIYLNLITLCILFSEGIGALAESNIEDSSNLHVRKKRVIDRSLMRVLPARLQDFPHVVQIQKNGHFICGGSILSPFLILSAAHCIMRNPNATYTVLSGSPYANTGKIHSVLSFRVHPGYHSHDFHHDIVILTIRPPIDLIHSPNRKITLHDGDDIGPHTLAIITGWGCTNQGGMNAYSTHLLSIVVPIIDEHECREASRNFTEISNEVICTFDRSGNRCSGYGDSGNPLMVADKLLGVMAWSPGFPDGKRPDIFTNVAHPTYRNWILTYARQLHK